ncbi:hypothetical protein D9M69_632490 [compost metagenome]
MNMSRGISAGIGSGSECPELIFSFFIGFHPGAQVAMPFRPAFFVTLQRVNAFLVSMVQVDHHIRRGSPAIRPVHDAVNSDFTW